MTSTLAAQWVLPRSIYRLKNPITAFAFFPELRDMKGYGGVCELPEGANLEICGAGFSDQTVKARCENRYYHVFRRDLFIASMIDHSAIIYDEN
jgi:hypothetical protein